MAEIRATIDDTLKARLDEIANSNDRPIAWEIVRAIKFWIEVNGNPDQVSSTK